MICLKMNIVHNVNLDLEPYTHKTSRKKGKECVCVGDRAWEGWGGGGRGRGGG